MMFAPTKGGELRNVIMHSVISANQKTESRVNRWLCAHALFDLAGIPTFVGAPNVISNVLITTVTKRCLLSDLILAKKNI